MGGKRKSVALDINSGKNWKFYGHAKEKGYNMNFTLGHPTDMEQHTHTSHYSHPITHVSVYAKFYKHIWYAYWCTNILRLISLLLRLPDTHMLRSSMVGSDTRLMPCHTGCQQISQWITPQPLDVHRAKGHKHSREGEEEEKARQSLKLAAKRAHCNRRCCWNSESEIQKAKFRRQNKGLVQ